MKVFIDPSRNIQNSIDREQRIRGCVDYYCLNMDHLRAFCDRPCRLSLWKRSLNPYRNIRIMDKKKKRKIKIDNFLRRITIRIFRYYTRLLLESRFHPNSDNLDNGLVNFFPNFSSKKNMIDVSGLKVIIKCILHYWMSATSSGLKGERKGKKEGVYWEKFFPPVFVSKPDGWNLFQSGGNESWKTMRKSNELIFKFLLAPDTRCPISVHL